MWHMFLQDIIWRIFRKKNNLSVIPIIICIIINLNAEVPEHPFCWSSSGTQKATKIGRPGAQSFPKEALDSALYDVYARHKKPTKNKLERKERALWSNSIDGLQAQKLYERISKVSKIMTTYCFVNKNTGIVFFFLFWMFIFI